MIENNFDIINDIINSLLNNFDFSYCLVVNIATYIFIKLITQAGSTAANGIWAKRLVLLICILSVGTFYNFNGADPKILLNSAILAPVSWSWIFKPICKKFKLDYKDVDDIL